MTAASPHCSSHSTVAPILPQDRPAFPGGLSRSNGPRCHPRAGPRCRSRGLRRRAPGSPAAPWIFCWMSHHSTFFADSPSSPRNAIDRTPAPRAQETPSKVTACRHRQAAGDVERVDRRAAVGAPHEIDEALVSEPRSGGRPVARREHEAAPQRRLRGSVSRHPRLTHAAAGAQRRGGAPELKTLRRRNALILSDQPEDLADNARGQLRCERPLGWSVARVARSKKARERCQPTKPSRLRKNQTADVQTQSDECVCRRVSHIDRQRLLVNLQHKKNVLRAARSSAATLPNT